MGATVLGNGLAWKHLGEVDYIEGTPQVHLHFLTSKDEEKSCEKVELVCHGCGESLLLYFHSRSWKTNGPHLKVKNDFRDKHQNCPNRNYEKNCPNYRKSCLKLDLRKKSTKTESVRKPGKRRSKEAMT